MSLQMIANKYADITGISLTDQIVETVTTLRLEMKSVISGFTRHWRQHPQLLRLSAALTEFVEAYADTATGKPQHQQRLKLMLTDLENICLIAIKLKEVKEFANNEAMIQFIYKIGRVSRKLMLHLVQAFKETSYALQDHNDLKLNISSPFMTPEPESKEEEQNDPVLGKKTVSIGNGTKNRSNVFRRHAETLSGGKKICRYISFFRVVR